MKVDKNIKKNKFLKQKGFTLLETLLAIFILTLSITGPIYIASLSFRNTIDSRDNISAQYLAEEVVEVIKNKRDKRVLEDPNKHWLKDITSIFGDNNPNCFNTFGSEVNKCYMNWDLSLKDYTFSACNSSGCPNMKFDKASNDVFYDKNNSLETSKFIREFYIQKGVNDTAPSGNDIPNNEAVLVVNIRWKDKGIERVYSIKERLYAVNYNKYFIQ